MEGITRFQLEAANNFDWKNEFFEIKDGTNLCFLKDNISGPFEEALQNIFPGREISSYSYMDLVFKFLIKMSFNTFIEISFLKEGLTFLVEVKERNFKYMHAEGQPVDAIKFNSIKEAILNTLNAKIAEAQLAGGMAGMNINNAPMAGGLRKRKRSMRKSKKSKKNKLRKTRKSKKNKRKH